MNQRSKTCIALAAATVGLTLGLFFWTKHEQRGKAMPTSHIDASTAQRGPDAEVNSEDESLESAPQNDSSIPFRVEAQARSSAVERIEAAWGWPISKVFGRPIEIPLDAAPHGSGLLPGYLYAFVETSEGKRIVSPPVWHSDETPILLEAVPAVAVLDTEGRLIEGAELRIEWSTFGKERQAPWSLRSPSQGTLLQRIAPGVFQLPLGSGNGEAELWRVSSNGSLCGHLVDSAIGIGVNPILAAQANSVSFSVNTRCLPPSTEDHPWQLARLDVFDRSDRIVASHDLALSDEDQSIVFDHAAPGFYTYEVLLQRGSSSANSRLDLVESRPLTIQEEPKIVQVNVCVDLPLPEDQRLSQLEVEFLGTPGGVPQIWKLPNDQNGDPAPISMTLSRRSLTASNSRIPARNQTRRVELRFNGVDRYEARVTGLTPGIYDLSFPLTGMTGEIELLPGQNIPLRFGPLLEASLDLHVLGVEDEPLTGTVWLSRSLSADSKLEERHLGRGLAFVDGILSESAYDGSWKAYIWSPGHLGKTIEFDLNPGPNDVLAQLDPMPTLQLTHPETGEPLTEKASLDLRFLEGEFWGAENPLYETDQPGAWLVGYEGSSTLTFLDSTSARWTAVLDFVSGASITEVDWLPVQ